MTLSGAAVMPPWHRLAYRAVLQLLGDVGIAPLIRNSLFFPLVSLTLSTIQVFAKVSDVLAAKHEQILILLGQGSFQNTKNVAKFLF